MYQEKELVCFDGQLSLNKKLINQIKLSESKSSPYHKEVSITDEFGRKMKTSNLFLKKEHAPKLENGTYYSMSEIQKVLQETLETTNPNQIVMCKRTQKQIEINKVLTEIIKMLQDTNKLKLIPDYKDNDSFLKEKVWLKLKEMPDFKSQGLFLLRKKAVVRTGAYIHEMELKKALADYLLFSTRDIEKALPPKKESITHKIKKVLKRKWKLYPIALAGALIASMGCQVSKPTKKFEEQIKETKCLEYSIDVYQKEVRFENKNDIEKRVLDQIEIGNKLMVNQDLSYYESSDYLYGGANKQGKFGTKEREVKEYEVDQISILINGKIVKKESQQGIKLSKLLTGLEAELNTPGVDCMVHLSNPVSGWVNIKDILQKEAPQKQEQKEAKYQIQGQTTDFDGSITLNNNTNPITINVLDDQGNLLENKIRFEENNLIYEVNHISEKLEQQITYIEQQEGWKLEWNKENISSKRASLNAALEALSFLAIRKKVRKKKRF
ncbi:MAG: hypothetical protein HFH86_00395 [Bacilli bacterium]|jgi:hypothetical protein|nr:hypothetical protein [Bacilli bacterium]